MRITVNQGCRPVALTVERRTPNPGVGGSNPSWPANQKKTQSWWVGIAHQPLSFTILGVNVGRLQKKKTSANKKKKRTTSAKQHSQPKSNAGEKKSTPFSGSAQDANKGQTFAQRHIPSAPIRPSAEVGLLVPFKKAWQFLREVRVELKKVTWPSRKQTIGSTVVVLILVIIISFFLGAVDVGLRFVVQTILQ